METKIAHHLYSDPVFLCISNTHHPLISSAFVNSKTFATLTWCSGKKKCRTLKKKTLQTMSLASKIQLAYVLCLDHP